jgi:Domain of unknown function (DUF3846)
MKATIHRCEWIGKGRVIAKVSEEEVEIPVHNRLEFLQGIVGGLIDVYHHYGRDLIVNDEGLLEGLPLNPWAHEQGLGLVGNIVEVHGKLP